jgi:hypothetical protein
MLPLRPLAGKRFRIAFAGMLLWSFFVELYLFRCCLGVSQ